MPTLYMLCPFFATILAILSRKVTICRRKTAENREKWAIARHYSACISPEDIHAGGSDWEFTKAAACVIVK
jgi:hypothetical protein